MMRPRALLPLVVCLVLGATASAALASPKFRPRVGGAMGLVPTFNKQGVAFSPDIASGGPTQVTYHGGSVMSGGVTVHAIFWDGGTNPFSGAPQMDAPTYEGLINQFFGDVAHDSTGTSGAAAACTTAAQSNCNVFTVLPAYAEGTTPGDITSGSYDITYATPIVDHDPYPPKTDGGNPGNPVQCQSANNTAVCVTDGQIQTEIDNEITAHGGSRGLNNLWFVFLPAGVDECITPRVCGTNDFGAYHSDFDDGHGTTIYAIAIDPVIEVGPISQGSDPQGNPDAEAAADAAGHETVEAITDPTGVGWLDSNGFEVADKCEFGSQFGTILGNSGPDNADYNQMINGHAYLEQEMWSLGEQQCVQGTTNTTNPLPLPQVNLTQFSPTVTGNIGSATQNVGVTVTLLRSDADGNPVPVAQAPTATLTDGSWQVTLSHAVGDDRDEIDVDYSGAGAPSPNHQVILTGNGGNPFTESGWTGWTALDNGYLLTNNDPSSPSGASVTMGPCFQTGVLAVTLNNALVTEPPPGNENSPTQFCSTSLDTADYDFAAPIGAGDVVTTSSNDNRAFQGPDLAAIGETSNPDGGLVNLKITTGEPDAASAFVNPLGPTFPEVSGFPTCTADLGTQTVTCTGLVPDAGYSVNGNGGTTDDSGTLVVPMPIHRGDSLALSNGSRTLTTLHVANLQVHIVGDSATVASGTCTPGDYYGPPLSSVPANASAGDPSFLAGGAALTGEICPTDTGSPAGLPTDDIAQTDDASGDQTMTEVADVADTSPMEGETVYGAFTALAEATDGVSPIALNITRGGSSVFSNGNVNTANGVAVPPLSPGNYSAIWTVSDPNGDTRTVTTRFIEQPALQGPQGPQGPAGPQGPRGKQGPPGPKPKVTCKLLKHNKIKCTVSFKKKKHGKLRVTVSRGGRLVALGHANVVHGRATLTMSELRTRSRGAWHITVVFSQTVQAAASTQTLPVRVR